MGMRKILIVLFFLIIPSSILSAPDTYLPLQYAKQFKILYLDNGCKLVVDGIGRKVLLLPKNQQFKKGKYRDIDVIIKIPVNKVIVRWTTIPPLLKALGVVDSVIGVTAPKQDWYIKEIKRRMEQGKTFYIGEYKSINYELLRALRPDIFFAGEWENTKILKEIDLPFAVVCEYKETHPLARLEWIKFFAPFYNKEKEAEAFFNKVVIRVKEILAKTAKIKRRPKVLWGFVTPSGMAYVPSKKSYVTGMIKMAGGDYVFKDLSFVGTAPITLEEFYKRGRNADIYISTGTLSSFGITSIKKLVEKNPFLADLKPIKEHNVWCFQPWYWESIDKTDEIIKDLATIFHPKLYPRHKIKFFLKLPKK